jgi:hypothetical protein
MAIRFELDPREADRLVRAEANEELRPATHK